MERTDFNIGWLSPDGSFFKCSSYDHTDTAEELVGKLNYPKVSMENRYIHADDNLMSHGWCYVGVSDFQHNEWRISWNKFLTEYQKQFLKSYFENEDINISRLSMWKWLQECA